ncbi:BspA family leucine-rich repeat surface protein [Enterococcus spodopteracolus]|uniref:BspA family leucine-rich repeat surface protein n=1 Tax=Enterococcus spodopteracolus TaxID=3034501 RepID=UPI002649D188|nr:BspA family leucine-rich repeat surface protein [Enterococcus spodopteracolus]
MKRNTIRRIIGKLLLIMVLLLPNLPFQLTYAHDYSSSSDNHEVTVTSEYPEKPGDSELNSLHEESNQEANDSISVQQISDSPEAKSSTESKVLTDQGVWGTVPWSYYEDGVGTIVLGGGTAGSAREAPWRSYFQISKIIFEDQVILPSDSSGMFRSLTFLESIENADKLDVSNVTNMESMFQVTWRLREIDVSNWDTSNVTNMRLMFGNLAATPASFTTLDLTSWDTSSVTNMSQMFMNAQSLTTLDLRGWDTSNVTDMSDMFFQANSLTTLDLGTWNTSKVTNMSRMFHLARSLTQLNLSSWDTSSVTNMSQMFSNTNLKSLTLREKSFFSAATQLPAIQQIDGYTGGWKLEPGTENLGIRYASSSEFMTNYDGRFPGTYTWETFGMWGTVPWIYDGILETITLYGGEAGAVADAPWKVYSSVKEIIVEDTVVLPEISSRLFSGLTNLEVIENAGNLDVSNVTMMDLMFARANSLKKVDVSNWNTSRVTTMVFMFNQASSLQALDVSQWDTSLVTSMGAMFQEARELKELDVSNWNTSQVRNISFMFFNARSLTELDMNKWDTYQVTNMNNMFTGTNNLKRISLGEKSIFDSSVNLPNRRQDNLYTGRWVLEESLTSGSGVIAFENSTDFMTNYDGSNPGTYIWEPVPPEQLIAKFDPVSDQSVAIHGHATESVDHLTITYKNTEGSTVVLEKDSPRILWGDYQDSQEKVRSFQINLAENERLETGSTVEIKLSKPSGDTTGDVAEEQTVIKGIDYRSNNFTLDRSKLNELATVEELHALILQESRAQAKNILSEEDMTNDFRIVETDLSLDSEEDGSYYAILEVGNKAYQMTIGIDLTSKVEHLRVTIPVKMVFESLYDEEESKRQFESQTYEIHNQSSVAVDTYINQVAIDDSAGIVLLKEGEDPLDYAESAVEDPSYEDITKPLLRLNLQTQETKKQLYATMPEQHLIRLSQGDRTPLSLSGEFYGDYPRWVDNPDIEQGGYYEHMLVPNYRIVLRFVPRT